MLQGRDVFVAVVEENCPPQDLPLASDTVSDTQTVLVRVNGPDKPGITAALMRILDEADAAVFDIEQFVVRGRLTLDLLVGLGDSPGTLKELLFLGWEHGVHVEFEVVEEPPQPADADRFAVTVLSHDVTAGDVRAVAEAIAEGGGNIHRIVRLSRYPVLSYEMTVEIDDPTALRAVLIEIAGGRNIDIAVQQESLERRAKRLVVLDVDSTLIQDEMIDMLATEAGVASEVALITDRAMRGELGFEQALRQRVALLAGLQTSALDRVIKEIKLTPGTRTFVRTLKRLGYRIGVVSGGFVFVTEMLKQELGLDHAFANELESVDGRLTGRVLDPVVDRKAKAELLRTMAALDEIPLEQTVAVGDGANDVDMLSAAGLGIAFNARPVVERTADTSLSVPYLDAILFILGIRREDVERADRSDVMPGR